MARPKGSKNRIYSDTTLPPGEGVEIVEPEITPPMADCPGLIEYVGPEGCVQFRGFEFVRGVPREVPPNIFDALSTRAHFEVR